MLPNYLSFSEQLLSAPKGLQVFVITGGPNSGKTTLIDFLASTGYAVLPEAATQVIQEGSGRGNSGLPDTNSAFQKKILVKQIEQELTARQSGNLLFCDRGIFDVCAYMEVRNIPSDAFELAVWHSLLKLPAPVYSGAFILEVVPVWEDNGIRFEGLEFSRRIFKSLIDIYRRFGIPVTVVPLLPVSERAEFVLSRVFERSTKNLARRQL
ncbi:AAA family ATPase [bacterium]|nr:AAA family ATPase [bacterium]